MNKKIFAIKNMRCASCASIIQNSLRNINGVKQASVNFATEKAVIEYDENLIKDIDIITSIEKIGYILKEEAEQEQSSKFENIKNQFTFIIAVLVFVIMIWDIITRLIKELHMFMVPMDALNIILFILSSLVLILVGKPFMLGILRFIKNKNANMDTLIGISTLTAYLYSSAVLFFPHIINNLNLPKDTYFDVTIVIIGFVILGKDLETKLKNKTGEAIKKLIGLQAKKAIVLRNNEEIEIDLSEVIIGDIIIVKPGAKIPVDGKIIEGKTSIDESMITGESMPVDKTVNDLVSSGTINKYGGFKMEAIKIGKDTMLAQIIQMVEDAQNSKAPIQALTDKISAVFVPVVIVISFLSIILWSVFGSAVLGPSIGLSYAIMAFIGVLVIACPCALGLATPTAIIAGVGKGAEYGILVKDAEALQKLSEIDTIVLDKTGTLTKGKPEVTDIITISNFFNEEDILKFAGSAEKMSEHPLGEAIVKYALQKNITLIEPSDFKIIEGVGVWALVKNYNIDIHKPNKENNDDRLTALQRQGKTVVQLKINNEIAGLIALSDILKTEAKEVVQKLKQKGIKVIMITGDNELTANFIANQAGISEVYADVLPHEKAKKIKYLQETGRKVAMVGDGINDAPALAQSDAGIAMATGTDVAMESAGITLLHGNLIKLIQAIVLARVTIRTIKQNLFWAFIYNIVGIPLAAGLFYPFFGVILNPIFAGVAMIGSSLSVMFNSLWLKNKKLIG